jgi:hypothetical protein
MDLNLISGQWVEIREESTPGAIMFRSIDSDIPPARGRRHLKLDELGLARAGGPSADDRVRFSDAARWQVSNDKLIVEGGEWQGIYRIKEADGTVLVLEPAS